MKILIVLLAALVMTTALKAESPGVPPRRVALVFDDGPDPVKGAWLQATLAAHRVPATFAHVGRLVERHPAVTRAAREAGHEIVNHSYSHARIGELDAAGVAAEVDGGLQAIKAALGARPQWYWPPYLAVDDQLRQALRAAELPLFEVHHLVDSHDWNTAVSSEEILRRATTDVRDGTVVLFHEWRQETIDQLPAILDELRRQGCVFLTFSALAQDLQRQPPSVVAP